MLSLPKSELEIIVDKFHHLASNPWAKIYDFNLYFFINHPFSLPALSLQTYFQTSVGEREGNTSQPDSHIETQENLVAAGYLFSSPIS